MANFELSEIRKVFRKVLERGELEGFSALARERVLDPEQEEGAEVNVSRLEVFSVEPEGGESFIGIDGSSRILDSFVATLAVAAATAVDRHGNVYLDLPLLRGRVLETHVPFVALAFDVDPGDALGSVPAWITTVSPSGTRYHRDYYRTQMAHEVRTALETEALRMVLEKRGERILLDGPVYPLPAFLFGSRVRGEYKEAYEVLIDRRLEVLRGRERRVIGVVKRLDLSHWISKSGGAGSLTGTQCSGLNDLQVMQLMLARLRREGIPKPYTPVVAGPLVLDPLDTSFPRKYMYYVVIPSRPYDPVSFTYLRLEALFDPGDDLGRILGDFSSRLAPLPLSVVAADKRSRRIVRCLASELYGLLRGEGVAFTYETDRMMEAVAWA